MMKSTTMSAYMILFSFLTTAMIAFIYGSTPVEAADEKVKKFQLYATDGYMTLPDGSKVYVWGYSLENKPGTAVFPAPTLEVNEGDQVEITLTNIGYKNKGIKKAAHTIHLHGLDVDMNNDGVPHTSRSIQVGESFTYTFVAKHAGTYFYHCHVDTIEHLQMGMHGALVVRAKDGVKQAWTGGPAYDKEYTFVLNEIDPVWHKAVETGSSYDKTDFHPRFWTINGKAYPDTENDPSTMIEGKLGEKVLVRLINSGYQPHSFHMHGFHFQVIATDGRPLAQPYEKDTILLGPGERYDILVEFTQSGHFPFHSHNITDNTNNGVYPGGLHTMIEVEDSQQADEDQHNHDGEEHQQTHDDGSSDTVSHMPQKRNFTLILKTGSKEALLNGKQMMLTAAPIKLNGTTYVPLSSIGKLFGASTEWIAKEQAIHLTLGQTKMKLTLNSKQAEVNGTTVKLVAPPMMSNNITMVPLRFVSETLEAVVQVSPKSGEITLISGTGKPETIVIEITNNTFRLPELRISAGTTVTWVNKDRQQHTVTDLGNVFDSGSIPWNGRWSYTFQETGHYTYYCTIHPEMEAVIQVE